AKSKAVYASVDVYYGPYGEVLDVIPSRQSLASVAMLLDDEYLKLAVLRPMEEIQLAKVADTDQRVLITECALVPGTELAHGIVADLTTA
ncbi:MAG: SU10 major capsid protein, partial [Candidatus Saccharimonadales bacterium]